MAKTLCILLLMAASALAASKKISPDLLKIDPEETVTVIVQYDHAPSGEDHQKVTDKGGTLKQDLSVIKSSCYSMKRKLVDEIAEDTGVVRVSLDHGVGSARKP